MGQAKLRGTLEERRKAAIIRNEAARLDKLAHDMQVDAGLTDEQRARKKEARHRAASVLAMASGLIASV
jgi:hypothetical protein